MDFELDVAKWRCGGTDGVHPLGKGVTRLLNNEGYMCCLGQFSKQCMDITDEDITGKIDPECVFIVGGGLTQTDDTILVRSNEDDRHYHYKNTKLSNEAIQINDNVTISNKERIHRLKELFSEHGHTITVINEHLLEENV